MQTKHLLMSDVVSVFEVFFRLLLFKVMQLASLVAKAYQTLEVPTVVHIQSTSDVLAQL